MSINRFHFTFFFVSLFLLHGFTSSATLTTQEVDALRDVAKALKKTNWDFSVDPCDVTSTSGGWRNPNAAKGFEDDVTCDCSFVNGTLCHVTSIIIKSQNLQGNLPPELIGLPFLRQIDLSRNYLDGPIPSEWGSLPLVNITLSGNRLKGPIPKEIGSISTLVNLALESNQLSGELPPELGDLSSIQAIHLRSNNFSGKIPSAFAALTTLKDFRISDNRFTGTIPDFIKNWTRLEKLIMQASGLVGPIPDSIAPLVQLTDLRINDLSGPESPFPLLHNMRRLKILVLKNCNLTGELPLYFAQFKNLRVLDLSFNKLSGTIPTSYTALSYVSNIFFTQNMLNGTVPSWMADQGRQIDLTYNNFAEDGSTAECRRNNVNLFASSSMETISRNIFCLRSYRCPKTFYGLHINCGGDEVVIGETKYDADKDPSPSYFYDSENGWVSSNTGTFLNDDRITKGVSIWSNSTPLNATDPRLYMQARLSAISLTYYAFCLGNGNYTVNLHFAEIMFTNGKTYSSLGRRFFDIYVQGKLVKKDFNVVDEAGGAGNAVVGKFPVTVTNGKLEIRFYWAGKGTMGVPSRGVYGSLVSAISVDPDFIPPKEGARGEHGGGVSAGAMVGIAIASAAFLVVSVGGILWWRGCLRPKSRKERDFMKLDFQINAFSLRQIKDSTRNFDPSNKIGEGGFGPVYKGRLPDGTIIAVKQLSAKSKQGNREFLNEIGMISALQHPNLVKLHGCCIEGDQLLLVYEYMENNSLARALFGRQDSQLKLDWPTRKKICVGIARGLSYLHEESRLKIVHRDIKSTNVLLDKELNPKISDFGLAKLDEEDDTHISTRIAGTMGYMAPEYAMKGQLTDKADVYSFGVVALEIVSGRSNRITRIKDNSFDLIDCAHAMKEKNILLEMVDSSLGRDYDREEAREMINVAIICTSQSAAKRPSMSTVVNILEGRVTTEEIQKLREASYESVKETEKQPNMAEEEISLTDHSIYSTGPITPSSTSTCDLFSVKFDSPKFRTL